MRERFEGFLSLDDLSPDDQERDQKVLTRCLAALAIALEAGCSDKDAAEAVWDGQDDNGLDAVYHDINGSQVVIAQAKWFNDGSGEPAARELSSFADGVRDLVEDEADNFAKRLRSKLQVIGRAINTPGITLRLVIVTTGNSNLSQHGAAVIARILNELNGSDAEPLASERLLGLAEIYPPLAANQLAGRIDLEPTILDWSPVNEPYRAYFGVIDGSQLKTWWVKHGRRLVAENLRYSLGPTDVNEQLKRTAVTYPEHFWYFNNGITLIADEVLRAPGATASRSAGVFSLKGASIVNGAQTVSSLGRVKDEDDERLARVRVPIRVILLRATPEGFGGQVTRTNNLQNRVELRDFVAQDPEQTRLRLEMAMEGVEYQFVRSDDYIPSAKACELIEVTTALACASGDPNHATIVKTGIGRIFIDLSRAPYRALFNPSLSGVRAYNATVLLRRIDNWIENKKNLILRRSGYQWGTLIHGNRILAAAVIRTSETSILSSTIADFEASLARLPLESHCEEVYAAMVKVLERDFASRFLAVLFKSPVDSRAVYEGTIRMITV
ncbi:AIPR family protein [Acidisoma sp. C75]